MKKTSSVLTTVGAIASLLTLSACGGGGGPAADADTPEGQAFAYRDSLMTLLASKLGVIGGMAREEIPLDEDEFREATADLAALAGMLLDGFQEEGLISSQSRTLPAVWEQWSDFQARANDLAEASQGLADAAASGGFAAAQGLVQGTQGTCGGCHRTFRERLE